MKRIRATLKPKEGNFGKILRAFFADVVNMQKDGTKIYVKDGKINLEVAFEKSPNEIIKVISECTLEEIENFNFWMEYISPQEEAVVDQNNQENTQKEEAVVDQDSQENSQKEETAETIIEDNSSQEELQQDVPQDVAGVEENLKKQGTEEPQEEINPDTPAKVATRKGRPKRIASISYMPELDEILKNTKSFEEFVSEVIKWAGIEKKSEYFKSVLAISEEEKHLTWKSIEKAMDERKIPYVKYDETWCRKELTKKLANSGYDFVALEFIKIVVQYKEKFSLSANQMNSEKGTQRETVKSEEIQEHSGETNSKFLPCMPLVPNFDEKISEMELEWSVQEKAEYILEVMGINSEGGNSKNNILNFVKEVLLAKSIASYVKTFSEKNVQVFDFLSDLRKLVIS